MNALASTRSSPKLDIDIVTESDLWNACPDADAIIRRAIDAASPSATIQ